MSLIDLTHAFDEAIPVYPGDPPTVFRRAAEIATEGYLSVEVTAGMHAGTHIDAPAHMFSNGDDIASIPLDRCIGRGVLIDVRNRAVIDEDLLSGVELRKGDIVLLMSGRSGAYRSPEYFHDAPVVTEACARALADAGISMLGIDFASPDAPPFATHRLLLDRGILIIENLANLETLVNAGNFEVIAMPVKIAAEAAPARVIAKVHEDVTPITPTQTGS